MLSPADLKMKVEDEKHDEGGGKRLKTGDVSSGMNVYDH